MRLTNPEHVVLLTTIIRNPFPAKIDAPVPAFASSTRQPILTQVPDQMISYNHRRHSFYNGQGAGDYAHVVSSACQVCYLFPPVIQRFLFHGKGGNRFESDPAVDLHPVANPTLNSARMVGLSDDLSFLTDKPVVMC